MNYDQLDHKYHRDLQQFVNLAIGKEPEEMRVLFVEFLPQFIEKITVDIRIAINAREKAQRELMEVEERISLHGVTWRNRKNRQKHQKSVIHMDSVLEMIRNQVDHWEKMRIAFSVVLPEVEGMSDDVTADSRLCDLFPDLYIGNML